MIRILSLLFFAGLLLARYPEVVSGADKIKHSVIPGKELLKSGDVVLRTGKGVISRMMKTTSSRDKKYSHAGILILTATGPRVFHVIGTPGHPEGSLRNEPLDEFCNSGNCSAMKVIRYPLKPYQSKMIEKSLSELSRKPIRFDEDFDLVSEDALYCTELIFKLMKKVTGAPGWIPFTTTGNGPYIGLDDLYLNPYSTTILELNLNP